VSMKCKQNRRKIFILRSQLPTSFPDVKLHHVLKLAYDDVGIDVDPEQGAGGRRDKLPEVGVLG
jgi:hypothetical protein